MIMAKAYKLCLLAVVAVFLTAAAAFAYPNPEATYPEGLARTDCADCHGREADEASDTVAATRKGPHGDYSAGTSKCQTCHYVHTAPAEGTLLLPGATVKATCESCHDGTGGRAVYGVVYARTGLEPAATHSVETTRIVPGGDPSGDDMERTFSGPNGTLTCVDCHSPHDTGTVEPFYGDRTRATAGSEDTTAGMVPTNRLLRQAPGVTEYGASWCASSCHAGRTVQHRPDSGLMQYHPVIDDDSFVYDSLPVVVSADSTETTMGRLGQSNTGYVMPFGEEGIGSRSELQSDKAPLCQQCHEDARNVGPSERGGEPMLSEDQTFTVNAYASLPSEESTDNPGFQVFPHESDVEYFLVRPITKPDDESLSHQLCLNCHSLRHDVPEEYEWCTDCHDAGDAADIHEGSDMGCLACHTVNEPVEFDDADAVELMSTESGPALTLDCGTCHTDHPVGDHGATSGSGTVILFDPYHEDLGPPEGPWGAWVACGMCHGTDISAVHGNRCVTCHPAALNAFDTWDRTCQQSGCHPTYHEGSPAAHAEIEADCVACHQGGSPGAPLISDFCTNCHATFSATNTTPPVTVANVQGTYTGPARIAFSVEIDGKIGIGTTLYRLNGARVQAGSSVLVTQPGAYSLEYWSVDQNGNVEAPAKSALFTVGADTTPPVTTAPGAQSEYFNTSPTINLVATDASSLGVKTTYYMVNAGPVQTGTRVSIPQPAAGTVVNYTVAFRSEDWSGNVEEWKSVSFTVASGNGIIRLVWGDSDISGPPGGGAEVEEWTVRRGSHTGLVIDEGFAGGPGWSGVIDIAVPVHGTAYFVYIREGESSDWHETWIGNVSVKVPGEIVRVPY